MDPSKQPGIRFLGVELLRLHFDVKGDVPRPIPFGLDFTIDRSILDEGKSLDVLVHVDMFKNVEEKDKPPIEFKFVLVGHFTLGEEPNMTMDEFAKDHAPAHLVPYVRELISNITARCPLPMLNVGPINVAALVDTGQARFEFSSPAKAIQQA